MTVSVTSSPETLAPTIRRMLAGLIDARTASTVALGEARRSA
jgi:hypothetical protein